mmetsp:Transcript_19534/g.36538  ORF Transcript_19534/g.36538 Transcript_19534/m.36538 type:complete len:360 (-) Transcript_19534:1608-2687(-)
MMIGTIAVILSSAAATTSSSAFAFSPITAPITTSRRRKHISIRPNNIEWTPIITPDGSTSTGSSAVPPTTRTHHHATTTRLQSSLLPTSESITTLLSTLFQNTGNVPFLLSLLLNTVLFTSLRPKLMTMLTPSGYLCSLALGTVLWTTLGWRGWTVCVLYLFLGQLVTKIGFEEKESLGIAEGRGGRRGPENVWGSAFTGSLCAIAAAISVKSGVDALGISNDVWVLGYVASLATKLADTFASEIGKAYGKTTFLITNLKSVPRGTEGAISLEGTLASVVGGLSLSAYAYLGVGLISSLEGLGVATFAAFFATMCESLIGATLQEKEGFGWMTNEVVNFFNTLIGAAVAMAMGVLVLGM